MATVVSGTRQFAPTTAARVKVLVRIRPAAESSDEDHRDPKSVVVVRNEKTVELHPVSVLSKLRSGLQNAWPSQTKMRMFSFDKVFRPRCSQAEIFDNVKSCVTLCSKGLLVDTCLPGVLKTNTCHKYNVCRL